MPSLRGLSRTALATTLLLVTLGGFTRGSGSGYGCADRWPLCENGLLGGILPRLEFHMVVEWGHRFVAFALGLIAVMVVVAAWRRRESQPGALAISVAAVLVIAFQAWVGRLVVQGELAADLVSMHLAISMVVVALYTWLVVATSPNVVVSDGARDDGRWVGQLTVGAGLSLAVLLVGSYVHNLYFGGWPLMGGAIVPDLSNRLVAAHFLHRVLALTGLAYLGYLAITASRRQSSEKGLIQVAFALYALNIGIGAAHVFTRVSSSALVALHLGVAAAVWSLLFAAQAIARRGSGRPNRLPTSAASIGDDV